MPRAEFRGANLMYGRAGNFFRIVTVYGTHDIWIDPCDDQNSGWRYELGTGVLTGGGVAECIIKDFNASIPVDVLWEQDWSGRWTRTENAR